MRDAPLQDVGPDADVTAPLVTGTVPANNATGVARTITIIVNFDEAVFNVDTLSFSVMSGGSAVNGIITAPAASMFRFTPNNMLMPNTTVTVSLTSAIADFVGNPLVPVSISFVTGN